MNSDTVKGHTTLTREQKAHFDLFGFLVLRRAFSEEEMQVINHEYDRIMAHALLEQGLNGKDAR